MDAQQRAGVISQARQMIVKMGVKALRMDDVAQATRTSKRTLYETFGDKEELLFLAVQEHFSEFETRNAQAAVDAPNILVAMMIVMDEIRRNAEVNWQIRIALKRFYPNVSERLWNDKQDAKRKIVARSIREGIREGYIEKRINVELTMNMFSYISVGVTENNEMISIPSELNVEDAFQEVLINYMRGISTPKGIAAIDDYIAKKQINK